jgi:TonB family protein
MWDMAFGSYFGIIRCLLLVACMGALAAAQDGVQRKAVNQAAPDYPELARRMNLSGTVKIEVTINTDGTIKNTKVVGGNPLLAASAEKTVKTWKYEPAKYESTALITVKFGTTR